jgi:hypothetical protein
MREKMRTIHTNETGIAPGIAFGKVPHFHHTAGLSIGDELTRRLPVVMTKKEGA